MPGATYVALGDSYAAGIGSGTPGDRCRRVGGYPPILARALGVDLAYQACHGATVEDVRRVQLGALGPDTRLVTLTVGGNDAGFTDVLLAAAKPRALVDGVRVIEEARRRTRLSLPMALLRLLRDARRLAPTARIVVTGYPHLLGARDCRWYTFFSPAELAALRAGTDDLVDLVLDAARRSGALTVDVRGVFADHHACAPEPWIHDLTWPFTDSFHPTPHGHAVYAGAVMSALAGVDLTARSLGAPQPVRPAALADTTLPGTTPADTMPPDRPASTPRLVPGPELLGSAPRMTLRTLLAAGTRPPTPAPGP